MRWNYFCDVCLNSGRTQNLLLPSALKAESKGGWEGAPPREKEDPPTKNTSGSQLCGQITGKSPQSTSSVSHHSTLGDSKASVDQSQPDTSEDSTDVHYLIVTLPKETTLQGVLRL